MLPRLLDRPEIPGLCFRGCHSFAGASDRVPSSHLEYSFGAHSFRGASDGDRLVWTGEGFSGHPSGNTRAQTRRSQGFSEAAASTRRGRVPSPGNDSFRAASPDASPSDACPAESAAGASQNFAGASQHRAARGPAAGAPEVRAQRKRAKGLAAENSRVSKSFEYRRTRNFGAGKTARRDQHRFVLAPCTYAAAASESNVRATCDFENERSERSRSGHRRADRGK